MPDQRNVILAIALSLVVLLGFQFLFAPEIEEENRARQEARQQQQATTGTGPVVDGVQAPAPGEIATAPSAPGLAATVPSATIEQVLGRDARLAVQTPSLTGSIRLDGGHLDDLILTKYRVSVEEDSDNIRLLRPTGGDRPYRAEFGWVSADTGLNLPGPGTDSVWEVRGNTTLSPGAPVTLTWDNGQGLLFTRTIEVDEDYLFTVTQRMENNGETPVDVFPFGLISRTGTPETLGYYILHEGLIGVFDEVLDEVDYDDLREDGTVLHQSTGGWLGITDKYWLVALVPDQSERFEGAYRYVGANGIDRYQVDFRGEGHSVQPGTSVEVTNHLFAGAKVVEILNGYREDLGFARFDFAVDFGWLHFMTRPLFWGLHYAHAVVGNYGVAILIITVLIKIVFFPLANKAYVSMSKLKKLHPEMLKIRERYSEDKMKMNQEMMGLYKKHKVNPASGCLPILIQIPVFFALYKVLFVTIEMRHAPFFGWIQDLSVKDPTNMFELFGLVPWGAPEFLAIGIWPLIMGVTMYMQQKLNPAPADPIQAKIFMFLPIVFTIILAPFPAGLVIYWAWNNTLSILQQYVIMRRMGVPIGGESPAPKPADKT